MGKKQRRREALEVEAASSEEKQTSSPMYRGLLAVLLALLASVVIAAAQSSTSLPRLYAFTIRQTYQHDPDAFTQGLEYDQLCSSEGNCTDVLWESTGMNGRSSLRQVELATGRVLRTRLLPAQDFGEGLTKVGDRLIQLTWQSGKAYLYAATNFEDVQEIRTPLSDGWGITNMGVEGSQLILSDGSSILTGIDPQTYQKRWSVQVRDDGRPVRFLNELEWVRGEVWANVWQTECIARIDHKTGSVKGWVLMHGLLERLRSRNQRQTYPMDVLNGIAWDRQQRRLFVTGKYWPELYEVAVKPHPHRRPEMLAKARQQCII